MEAKVIKSEFVNSGTEIKLTVFLESINHEYSYTVSAYKNPFTYEIENGLKDIIGLEFDMTVNNKKILDQISHIDTVIRIYEHENSLNSESINILKNQLEVLKNEIIKNNNYEK